MNCFVIRSAYNNWLLLYVQHVKKINAGKMWKIAAASSFLHRRVVLETAGFK